MQNFCSSGNRSPQLRWRGAPKDAERFVPHHP